MKKILHMINQKLAELCGWFLMIIMVLLIIDLATRGIGKPVQGLSQIAVFVTIAVIYLGLPLCEEYDGHVRVELFINRLSRRGQSVSRLIIYILNFLIIGFFLFEMVQNFVISYSTKEAISGTIVLPVWPSKFAMIIGLLFFWLQILFNFMREFWRFRNKMYEETHNAKRKILH